MNKNGIIKFLIILTTLIITLVTLKINSMASTQGFIDFDPNVNINQSDADSIIKFANVIIGVVQIAGTAIGIIMIIMLGIKYMSAAPTEKAEFKKTATIYIIGAIFLFGASGILQMIKEFALTIK